MIGWEVPMVLSGALFTGGVVWFAWMRIPAWRTMAPADAEADFADSIRRADRVQPALLVVTLAAAIAFSLDATGSGRTLALGGIGGCCSRSSAPARSSSPSSDGSSGHRWPMPASRISGGCGRQVTWRGRPWHWLRSCS